MVQKTPYEINKYKIYLYIKGQQDHSQYFPSFRCHFCSHYFSEYIFYPLIDRGTHGLTDISNYIVAFFSKKYVHNA